MAFRVKVNSAWKPEAYQLPIWDGTGENQVHVRRQEAAEERRRFQ
jgi:hypothetical protein